MNADKESTAKTVVLGVVDLAAVGISPEDAAELRARFATIQPDWDSPEMDVYDDEAWWASLDDEKRAQEIAALRNGFEDADAGRVSRAAEVFARLGRVDA